MLLVQTSFWLGLSNCLQGLVLQDFLQAVCNVHPGLPRDELCTLRRCLSERPDDFGLLCLTEKFTKFTPSLRHLAVSATIQQSFGLRGAASADLDR